MTTAIRGHDKEAGENVSEKHMEATSTLGSKILNDTRG